MNTVRSSFSKSSVSTLKRKAGVFKFLKFEELRFRDGLVWTVSLTMDVMLCFQISQAWCERNLTCLYTLLAIATLYFSFFPRLWYASLLLTSYGKTLKQ